MKKSECMFCGMPATLLCDGLLGWDADTDENGLMCKLRKMHTCDAPMCRDCATWQNNIFFSGRAGGMETKDYCPICQKRKEAGEEESRRCMGNEQAMVIRRAHWATHQNDRQRKLQVLQGGGQQQLPF